MGSKKERISCAPVKGMRDVFPDDMAIRNWLFSEWKTVSQLFGFEEYDSAICCRRQRNEAHTSELEMKIGCHSFGNHRMAAICSQRSWKA